MVRLLDLVEEDHAVGPAADRLGELAALLEADVAGRGADQAGHRVLFLVLRHVDADHGPLVVEEELGQGAGQLGLADAGRPQEDERADGPIRILQPGAGADDRLGHRGDRLVLADDALVQLFLQVQQLLHLAFQQLRHRDAGPAADDLGDVLLVDFFLDEPEGALLARQLLFLFLELAFQGGQLPVLQLGGPRVVAPVLGLLELLAGRFDCLAQIAEPLHRFFLGLPLGFQCLFLLGQVGQLLLQLGQPLLARPGPSPSSGPRARSPAA